MSLNRYDTVGTHLLSGDCLAADASDHDIIQYEGVDTTSDPRIIPWLEELQSATTSIESRLASLESCYKQTKESMEIKK